VRLVAIALTVAALVFGIGGGIGRTVVADHAADEATLAARSHLEGIVTTIKYAQEPLTSDEIDKAAGVGTTWAVKTAGVTYFSSGLWRSYFTAGQSPPVARPGLTGVQFLRFTLAPLAKCVGIQCDLAGRTLTAVEQTVTVSGSPVSAYVLVWPFAAAEALSTVDPVLLIGGLVGLLLVGLAAWFVVCRVLRRVEQMRTELVDITAHDLSRRVPVPAAGDELQQWAITTNETLDRLEAAVSRYRGFVDDAAHELRSPLASLLSTLEVAAAHPDRADLPVVVGTALAEARRLQRLTDDLLLLARLDRAVPVHTRVVDLDALAAEQVAERRFAGVGPHVQLSTVESRVLGDEGQLERVLRNLLDNATRYAEHEVLVTLARRDGWVELAVADDGPGIPAADRSRIFDRFTRLDPSRDSSYGGTGLGLAIARDIVRGHGGRIEVADSRAGARVVVRLPEMRVPAAATSELLQEVAS
jgi:signal transduction histidine kinase